MIRSSTDNHGSIIVSGNGYTYQNTAFPWTDSCGSIHIDLSQSSIRRSIDFLRGIESALPRPEGLIEVVRQMVMVEAAIPEISLALRKNNTIEAALSAERDATGLCTVRDWAELIMMPSMHNPIPRVGSKDEMTFTHKGKRYNVEMIVTRVEDAKDGP